MFGIARTTATGSACDPRPAAACSMAAVVTPAAMDRIRDAPTDTAVAAAPAMSPGLTASTAPRQAGRSDVITTPGNIATSCSRRAGSASQIARVDGSVDPAASRPPTSAAPMFPPPITARSNGSVCASRVVVSAIASTVPVPPGAGGSLSRPGRCNENRHPRYAATRTLPLGVTSRRKRKGKSRRIAEPDCDVELGDADRARVR